MAEIYKVDNLTEALNLAKKFKLTRKYDLFRGQSQNWKVVSTVGRLNKEEFYQGKEKLERLLLFLQSNPSLEKFASNIDWFYAVAQHYGLPTNYIDFSSSPDVAAYFATNSKSNKIGEESVIICLNENDFNKFVNFSRTIYEKDKVIPPYIVKTNVDNLWRLQAQKGCFLYTPYADIEFYYDFDRIIFPYSYPFNEIPKEHIYPIQKSELEILLDQYFNSEKRLEGNKRFKKFATENNIPHHTIPSFNIYKYLKSNKIHPSWYSEEFKKWNFKINEEWNSSNGSEIINVHFSFNESVNNQIELIVEEISTYFNIKPIKRSFHLDFIVISKPKLSENLTSILKMNCSRIWNGTRNLPFTDKEIFIIIAKYICLEIYENKFDKIPHLTTEELIVLELTNEYGSITRCCVSPSKLVAAFRNDINEILKDELTLNISSEILLCVNKPDLIFDFNNLLQLFKEELIAYQVLHNSENSNPVIFYAPTQISVLGYA